MSPTNGSHGSKVCWGLHGTSTPPLFCLLMYCHKAAVGNAPAQSTERHQQANAMTILQCQGEAVQLVTLIGIGAALGDVPPQSPAPQRGIQQDACDTVYGFRIRHLDARHHEGEGDNEISIQQDACDTVYGFRFNTWMPVTMKEKVTMGLKWAPLAGAPTYAISGTNTCGHMASMCAPQQTYPAVHTQAQHPSAVIVVGHNAGTASTSRVAC